MWQCVLWVNSSDGGRRASCRPRLVAFVLVELTPEVPQDGTWNCMWKVRQKSKQHGYACVLGGSPVRELHPRLLRLH